MASRRWYDTARWREVAVWLRRHYRVAHKKPYTPAERYTDRARQPQTVDLDAMFLVSRTARAGGREAPRQEELFLEKEITRAFSKFRLHKTETGDQTPEKFKYAINLKIARMEHVLSRVAEHDAPRPTALHIMEALRNVTEHCIRCWMVLWFSYRHSGFLHRLAACARGMSFTPQESALLIWMFGKLGTVAFKAPYYGENPTRELLTALLRQLLREGRCSEMPVRDLMLLINGLANLHCTEVPYVLDVCLPGFMKGLSGMTPSMLALFVWSYGRLGYQARDPAIQQGILKACEARDSEMTVQQRNSIAWGLCQMGHPGGMKYLAKCGNDVQTGLGQYVPLGTARLMEACLQMDYHPGDFVLRMMANRFGHFRSYATPALCTQALPAFAYFAQFPSSLFNFTLRALQTSYRNLIQPEERIRILSSYALADALAPSFLQSTVDALLTEGRYEDLPTPLLKELWMCVLSHTVHFGKRIENGIPKKFKALMQNAWKKAMEEEEAHSLSDEVVEFLKNARVTCSPAYREPNVGIMADVVCFWGKKREVVFVVDAPDVFSNLANRLNGHYLWKERLFLKLGYGVGRIDAERWRVSPDVPQKRRCLAVMLESIRSLPREGPHTRERLHHLQDVVMPIDGNKHI